jgi:Zn finger protein HypA/HybF involved in hydrogenase expression
MSRLRVRCECCGIGFALRDNGFEDPAAGTWCPRCGSRNVGRWDTPAQDARPEAAA